MAQKVIDVASETTVANTNNIVSNIKTIIDGSNDKINSIGTVEDIPSDTSIANSPSSRTLHGILYAIWLNTKNNINGAKSGTISQKITYVLNNVGDSSDTNGTSSTGTVMAKLNNLLTNWTSTRANYINDIRSYSITNNTANKTGTLSQKDSYIISLLENSTYGLNALKNNYLIKSIQRGIATFPKNSDITTITINDVDINKTIFINGGTRPATYSSSSAINDCVMSLLNSTTLQLQRDGTNNTISYMAYVSWQVIEFN